MWWSQMGHLLCSPIQMLRAEWLASETPCIPRTRRSPSSLCAIGTRADHRRSPSGHGVDLNYKAEHVQTLAMPLLCHESWACVMPSLSFSHPIYKMRMPPKFTGLRGNLNEKVSCLAQYMATPPLHYLLLDGITRTPGCK